MLLYILTLSYFMIVAPKVVTEKQPSKKAIWVLISVIFLLTFIKNSSETNP